MDPFLKSRRISIGTEDVVAILSQENPFITKCTPGTQEQLNPLGVNDYFFGTITCVVIVTKIYSSVSVSE